MSRLLFSFLLFFSFSLPAHSQGETKAKGPRSQLATVMYAGLGGAVIGLSTLSFHGRPQDNLINIAYGFGAGLLFGAYLTTRKAIKEPDEFYGPDIYEDDFSHLKRESFQYTQFTPKVSWSWEF